MLRVLSLRFARGFGARGASCLAVPCPEHSSCDTSQDIPNCVCDQGYVVNLNKTGCEVGTCFDLICPENAHCFLNDEEVPDCACNEGYVVNADYTACIPADPRDPCATQSCPPEFGQQMRETYAPTATASSAVEGCAMRCV